VSPGVPSRLWDESVRERVSRALASCGVRFSSIASHSSSPAKVVATDSVAATAPNCAPWSRASRSTARPLRAWSCCERASSTPAPPGLRAGRRHVGSQWLGSLA